jgi:hypothetical protein
MKNQYNEQEIIKSFEEKFNQLPSDLKKEVLDFVNFLLTRIKNTAKKKPKLDWIGGLREYRDKYTSISLQKESLKWRY